VVELLSSARRVYGKAVYVYKSSGGHRGSGRKVYFGELWAGIHELCGFLDMCVLQNRRDRHENCYSIVA